MDKCNAQQKASLWFDSLRLETNIKNKKIPPKYLNTPVKHKTSAFYLGAFVFVSGPEARTIQFYCSGVIFSPPC